MSASLRALLSGIIDYAGMFPPAKLPLGQAIHNYACYRAEPEGWMLGRFVCPASHLPELTGYLSKFFRAGLPLAISAVGRGGANIAEVLSGLRADLEILADFQQRHGQHVRIEALETRFPANSQALGTADLPAAILEVAALIESARATVPICFLEVTPTATGSIANMIAQGDSAGMGKMHSHGRPIGVKLRCGGADAFAIPSSEIIAMAIAALSTANVPLKFTAGLHHPFRRFDDELQTQIHGFLNLFSAGVLVRVQHLSGTLAKELIEDENPANFTFEDDGLAWKDRRASLAQITSARQEGVVSFGSCSFDEPRHDLKALNLL